MNIRQRMASIVGIFVFSLILLPAAKAEHDIQPMYDIIIDVGHGGIDGGTSVQGVLEKDLNLVLGVKLFEALKERGYRVGITRIHDYALSDDNDDHALRSRHKRDLQQRTLIAQVLQPNMCISIHVNWSKNKLTRGPVVLYQPNEGSYHLAQIIQAHLNGYYQLNKGIQKGKTFFLLKKLNMPSVIVELGYLSNDQDRAILTQESSQNQLITCLVEAINEYFILYPNDK